MVTVHPRFLVEPDDAMVVEVAMAMKPGMGGWGLMPFAGGYAEQPAKLMQACRYVISLALKLDEQKRKTRSTPR